jgi:hypothetical protein
MSLVECLCGSVVFEHLELKRHGTCRSELRPQSVQHATAYPLILVTLSDTGRRVVRDTTVCAITDTHQYKSNQCVRIKASD